MLDNILYIDNLILTIDNVSSGSAESVLYQIESTQTFTIDPSPTEIINIF